MHSKTENFSPHLNTISSLPPNKLSNQYLSSRQKIANEFLLMNSDTKKQIRSALNKYMFTSEVFIPTPLRITKKDYIGKNYLLNNLVSFERNEARMKKYIEPLNTESKRFNQHYQLIMDENKEHQMGYLSDLTKFYKSQGYKLNGIGNVKEIFNPSFLLDNNFGINIVDDAFRYGYKDYKPDFSTDGKLMDKWNMGIKQTKETRNKLDKENEEKDLNAIFARNNINNKKDDERERENQDYNSKLESIKQRILEESRIKNMSRKQYHKYSKELKEEINKTKKTIEDMSSTNESLKSLKSNHITLKNLPKNVINKTYKIIHPSHDKNYKQKVVFTTVNNTRKSKEENIKSPKKKSISKKNSNDFFISIDSDKEKKKNKIILPKIQIVSDEENEKSKEKGKEKKVIINKSKKQLKELNDLYNLVSNNKENFFEKYPNKSVEKYFKKYTKKKIPILNVHRGSNVRGIFDDFQQIVNKKNFHKIAKSSNDIKKEFEGYKINSINLPENNNSYFDVSKIQEIDEKIPVMHYMFAEELMIKKTTEDRK